MRYRSRNMSDRSEGSDSDNRSNRSAQSRGSNRSHMRERYGRDSPTQIRRDRGGNAVRQQPSQRLLQITKKIAAVPTQNIKPSEHRFKNMTHPILPIRSIEENCSQVNQFRQWVNDRTTRSTEAADDMLDWVLHFEESKLVPQFTINLGADSLEVACWWRYFCIEIGILNAHNRVFRDLLCSAPRKTKEAEEDRM